jgi:O-antigen/teichoic acid export membrane protein
MLIIFFTLGLQTSLQLEFARNTSTIHPKAVLLSLSRFLVPMAPVISATGSILLYVISRGVDMVTLVAFSVYLISALAVMLGRGMIHGLGYHYQVLLADALSALAQLLTCVALHRFDALNATAMIVVAAAAGLVQACTQWTWLATRPEPDNSFTPSLRRLLRIGLETLPQAGGQWLTWNSDRIIVGAILGPGSLGIYGVASTFAALVWTVPSATFQYVIRSVTITQSHHFIRQMRQRIFALSVLFASMILIFGGAIIMWWLPEEFHGALLPLILLCMASTLLAAAQVDLAACIGLGARRSGAEASLTGGVALITIGSAMTWAFGIVGTAIASIIAYLILAYAARTRVRRREKEVLTS